jgi:hypothetical protein
MRGYAECDAMQCTPARTRGDYYQNLFNSTINPCSPFLR